jgi:hypothetical protein
MFKMYYLITLFLIMAEKDQLVDRSSDNFGV